MATRRMVPVVTPPGLKWVNTAAIAETSGLEPVALICQTHRLDPEELFSFYNYVCWFDKEVTMEKSHYTLIEAGVRDFMVGRQQGTTSRVKFVEPPREPAPRRDDAKVNLTPRGITYDKVTWVIKKSSLKTSHVNDIVNRDVWKNDIGITYVPDQGQRAVYSDDDVDTRRGEMKQWRDKLFRWALNLGVAKKVLQMLQLFRGTCPIWATRVSFFSAQNLERQQM